MKVDIHSTEGQSLGRQVDLPDDIFGVEPNEHVVYLAVKSYLAAQRQGTHKAKERGEIAGSTKKIKRQKGTGTARAGSIKNPLFRGGGRMFGPRPRTYDVRLNKKVSRLARKSALSAKAGKDQITLVEDFTMDAPRTKDFLNILKNLKVDQEKLLVLTAGEDTNLQKSGRNLSNVTMMRAEDANTYEIVNASHLVLLEGAVSKIQETFTYSPKVKEA